MVNGNLMLDTSRMITKRLLLPALMLASLTACFNSTGLQRGYLTKRKMLLPPPTRAAIVIPGFGNTRLYDPVNEKFVWGTPRSMVTAHFEDDLELPLEGHASDRLVPRGFVGSRAPINIAWRLSTALQRFGGYVTTEAAGDPTVYAFEFDWRLSFVDNGRKLGEFIDELRLRRGDPSEEFDIVGHSAGGLIVLAYLSNGGESLESPETWTRGAAAAASRVRRAVLVATPGRGSAEAFRFMARGETMLRRSLLPERVATFPSVFELLPFDSYAVGENGQSIDLSTIEQWKKYKLAIWSAPNPDPALERRFAELLDRTKRFQQALASRPKLVPTDMIAGDCVPTVKRVLVRDDGSIVLYQRELLPKEIDRFNELFGPGDGSILTSSAEGDDPSPTYLCTGHFGLASDPDAVRAILRLLVD